MSYNSKYRPGKLDDIVGNVEIINEIKTKVKSGEIDHMIFIGPPGVGKTTTAIAIAKELYGANYKTSLKELNASDERGIDVIRERVKGYASHVSINGMYKIIHLDEAEQLTNDAQQALRRIIEQYEDNCKFILSCNNDKIIPALKSRCSVYKFALVEDKQIKRRLIDIAKLEKFEQNAVTKTAIETIVDLANGDVRDAVKRLESFKSAGRVINWEVDNEAINSIVELSFTGNIRGARKSLFDLLKKSGTDERAILDQIYNIILQRKIPDSMMAELIIEIIKHDKKLILGVNKKIALDSMLCKLFLIGKKYKK